jgi:hypothetical protein
VFGLGPATRIYLAAGVTDMRKGFEGLYGLVRDRLSCEPLSGHLFLFCNAQRNRLKVLVWDGSGLWVCAGEFALLLSWLYPFPLGPEPLSRAVFPDRPDWAQCWKVFWHGLQPSLPQRLKRRFRVDVYSSLAKSISVHSPLSHTCGYLTGTGCQVVYTPE